ncbi:GtrA family protein [Sanguibacter sp. Leaf3]|uniref:GtrA family protein n=1 Tax=Sanguibacter sp. Leaf3 TaxID=1736209 RepID=UPI0009E888B0|nr:GtrA family protein [Sanguibacter sp. Leaf3]
MTSHVRQATSPAGSPDPDGPAAAPEGRAPSAPPAGRTEPSAPQTASAQVPAVEPRRSRRSALVARAAELLRFGTVGGVAFVVDTGLFNLLRFGPGDLLADKPLTAKVLSVAVATIVAWLGNRYWTFSDRKTQTQLREFIGFVVVNIGGMGIALGCLWFSHYVLDLRSPLADNISANGVGLVLGMVFRYLAYRTFVFTAKPAGATKTAGA